MKKKKQGTEAVFIDKFNGKVVCTKLGIFLIFNCFVKVLRFITDIFNELTHTLPHTHTHPHTRTYK